MPWRICFGSKSDKHTRVCIRIPLPWEIPQRIAPIGPSGPVSSPGDPSPWKWAESPQVPDERFRQLSALAAIDHLSQALDAATAGAIRKVVRGAANTPAGLPEGVRLEFE